MKRITTPVLALGALALATPVFAGNPVPAAPEPTIVQAEPLAISSSDWTGAYGGLALGYGWGDDALDGADDVTYGLFGGYDYDFGSFVLGGELDYTATELDTGTAELEDLTRLKLRAGYDAGPALIYGVVGAAYANADIAGVSYEDTGYTYGIGVDYALSESVNIGAELLQNDFEDFDNSGQDLSATTLGARVSFRF